MDVKLILDHFVSASRNQYVYILNYPATNFKSKSNIILIFYIYMYIFNIDHRILVIITILEEQMKKLMCLLLCVCIVLLCGCEAVGERDSISFISDMAKFGYDCRFEEIESSREIKMSCCLDSSRLSLWISESGKIYKSSLVFSGSPSSGFYELANAFVMSCCGFSEQDTKAALGQICLLKSIPSTTSGVEQTELGGWLLRFTADSAGGALILQNLRLAPTEALTVTTRAW